MDTTNKIWMISGTIAIVGASALLFTSGIMNPLVPMPFYLVIMAWFISYGFIVILPIIYLTVLKFLSEKNNFGKIILITTLIFSALSIFYFWGSWEYGVKYQGESHTKIVAAENFVGFISLIVLAYLGMRNNSKALQYSANLLLFLLLSWCAFPYLGEMP